MHFEILIEDLSGKEALNILLPKIIKEEHTFTIHSYKGVGHIPKNLKIPDAKTTALLTKLPRLITGYARSFSSSDYPIVLFIICDLDNKNLKAFKDELTTLINSYKSQLNTEICFAIREGEAWLLGDILAIKQAYSNSKNAVLNSYQNESIYGTWEVLADAIYDGGSNKQKTKGFQEIGKMKSEWAKKICPFMDINNNQSPSFNYFLSKLKLYDK